MYVDRVQQAVEGFVPDVERDKNQRDAVDECRQHSGTVVAEGLASVGAASLKVNGAPGEQQGEEVRKIVASLGQQRQAVGLDACNHQQDDVRQRDHQRNAEHTRVVALPGRSKILKTTGDFLKSCAITPIVWRD